MQPENAYMFPTSVKEVQALGWDYIDVIMVTGDAFVDHPSFGTGGSRNGATGLPLYRSPTGGMTSGISGSWGRRGSISGSIPGRWTPW